MAQQPTHTGRCLCGGVRYEISGPLRGFCNRCGGNLFWRELGGDATSIMAGTLDAPTGITVERHIFVADKSDYYELNDSAPKFRGW